jgi:hypothetical protein
MEALMTVRPRTLGKGALRTGAMVAGCLLVALGPSPAQNAPRKAANSAETTRAVLVEKAHALEARGRPDMAIQLWQQILLSDPNNIESLEGLARIFTLILLLVTDVFDHEISVAKKLQTWTWIKRIQSRRGYERIASKRGYAYGAATFRPFVEAG